MARLAVDPAPWTRGSFVASTCAALLGAGQAPRHLNNVLIESGSWLLPDWESLTQSDDDGIRRTIDLMAEVVRRLRNAGIDVVLAPVPFKARFSDDGSPAVAMSDGIRSRYGNALAMMRDRGLRVVDLDAALRTVARGRAAYFRTDQHWTADAAEAAGRDIAATAGSVAACPPAGAAIRHVERRYGDLTLLLPRDARAAIGRERFALRLPYDADLAGYDFFTGTTLPMPDRESRVHIVGNSFVRPMWGLPQTVSQALGSNVRLTFLGGNAGPYHTLLMGLSSIATPPRPATIVWQFGEAYLYAGPDAAAVWSRDALMPPDYFLQRVSELSA